MTCRCSSPESSPAASRFVPTSVDCFAGELAAAGAALDAGVPAAQVYPQSVHASDAHPHEVRIAFDGDAVLFSDEAELVYQRQGLDAFQAHEQQHVLRPLPDGPFKPVLRALHELQRHPQTEMRVRTALVTARSAPAHDSIPCSVLSASAGLLASGRKNSMPCAAASSSIATMCAVLDSMGVRRRAAKVAMLTWSSWLAEVGSESTLAGCARLLFSLASEAAVTWAIMKPLFRPAFSVRKGGRR